MKNLLSKISQQSLIFGSENHGLINKDNKIMIAKYIRIVLLAAIFVFSGMSEASATHVVGGELKYKSLGNDRYEVTLTFRRDCLNGADDAGFDDPANVWIFDGAGNLKTNLGVNGRLKMNFNSNDTLNQTIESDCGFEGTQVCVEETIYREIVRLPYDTKGYILAHQRCCRNQTIGNVIDPLETGGTWTAEIGETAQLESNENPNFEQWAPIYVCANEDVNFDHSATDGDGDSLVYKLCTPFLGATSADPIPISAPFPPYTPVVWKDPFNLNDLLGGDPLTINPETGLLTGTPNAVGQYLVGICVEEYRDGVKIGEVRRDFQYNVRLCSPPPTALFEGNEGNCDGPLVSFDNLSLGATEYQWNFNFPSTDPAFLSTEENPEFDYVTAGVYNVRLVVSRGTDQCSDTLIQQVAALFSDIEVMYDIDIEVCLDGGYSISITDTSIEPEAGFDIIGAEWTITQNDVATSYSGNVINLDIDDSDFVIDLQVESETGCKKSLTDTIMISDFEHVADFVFELVTCPDMGLVNVDFGDISDSINPFDSPQGYSWTVTNGTDVTTYSDSSFTYEVLSTAIFTVQLDVDFGGGCTASVTKTIDMRDVVANIQFEAEPFVICLGDTSTFVVDGSENFTYTWEPQTGLIFDAPYSMFNPGMVGVSDTEYAVTVTDGLCTVEAVLEVVVLDGSNIAISGDSITCDGAVELMASGGIGAGNFEWALTSDFDDIIFVGETLISTFDGQSETYFVRFTGESCGDPFAEYTVILSDIFDLAFNGDPVRVCLGDTVALVANPNPLLNYEWSPTTGLFFVDVNDGSSAMVIGIENTSYNLTISDDFCSFDTLVQVAIADAQNFTVVGDSIICTDTVTLMGSGAVGIGDYIWSLDESFTDTLFVGDELVTIQNDDAATYYVQFSDTTCGQFLVSYDVRKYEFNLVYAEPFMICPGDTIDYTIFNQGEGPLTWEWLADEHLISGGDSNMPTIGVGLDETEDFELIFTTSSPSGCMFTDTINFEIRDNPVVDFDFDLLECGEFTVCFTIDTTIGGFASWDFGDLSTTDDVSIDSAPCYTYPGPGVYEVLLTNLTSLCPFPDVTQTVTVNDEITIDFIADQVICIGDLMSLTATSPDLNIEYVWCTVDGDTLQLGPDYQQVVSNEFDLVIKAVDPNGCSSQQLINVRPFLFDIEDNVPTVFCTDEATDIEIFVNGTQDGFAFAWGPEDCVVSGGNTGNPVLQAAGSKEYSVTVTNIATGCDTIITYDITTTSFDIGLDAIDENGINTDTINQEGDITIFVIDADPDYMYEWSDGSTDPELIVSPLETTTYSVTVTDEMGCTATAEITITVRLPRCDDTDVFLPSAFTPNNDGVNDVLFLRSNFIDEMELLIYNRWGEEMFSTKDQSVGWDGTYKGETLAPDAFAYTLRVICINQAEYVVRGNVNLLK